MYYFSQEIIHFINRMYFYILFFFVILSEAYICTLVMKTVLYTDHCMFYIAYTVQSVEKTFILKFLNCCALVWLLI